MQSLSLLHTLSVVYFSLGVCGRQQQMRYLEQRQWRPVFTKQYGNTDFKELLMLFSQPLLLHLPLLLQDKAISSSLATLLLSKELKQGKGRVYIIGLGILHPAWGQLRIFFFFSFNLWNYFVKLHNRINEEHTSVKDGRCLFNPQEWLTSICRWKMLERSVLFWEPSESDCATRTGSFTKFGPVFGEWCYAQGMDGFIFFVQRPIIFQENIFRRYSQNHLKLSSAKSDNDASQ